MHSITRWTRGLLLLGSTLGCTLGCTHLAPRTQKTTLGERLRQLAARAPIVVAHRGDSHLYPENTLPAFESALQAGATMVELDFYQTADRVLVCFHDKTIARTTDGGAVLGDPKLRIADLTAAKVAALDAGSWKHSKFTGTRIPSLRDALRAIQPGAITMIEHKAGDPGLLVDLLRDMDLIDKVLVQSFDWEFLAAVARLEPGLTLAALGGGESEHTVTERLVAARQVSRAVMIHWSFKRLTKADVDSLHALGHLVCVYTIDSDADFARAIAMGVDAITTNRPARLREYLRRRVHEKTRD